MQAPVAAEGSGGFRQQGRWWVGGAPGRNLGTSALLGSCGIDSVQCTACTLTGTLFLTHCVTRTTTCLFGARRLTGLGRQAGQTEVPDVLHGARPVGQCRGPRAGARAEAGQDRPGRCYARRSRPGLAGADSVLRRPSGPIRAQPCPALPILQHSLPTKLSRAARALRRGRGPQLLPARY